MFADNSKLHKDISSHIDRLLLQEDLLSDVKWADTNNMELNREKFQLLQLDHVKDLGVYVDTDYALLK